MLEDVRGRFDFVVLDSPCLSQCNDALTLEPQTDGFILVTRPGITQQSLVTEAIDQLNESDSVRFLGAVVNGVEIEMPRQLVQPQFAAATQERSEATLEAAFGNADN